MRLVVAVTVVTVVNNPPVQRYVVMFVHTTAQVVQTAVDGPADPVLPSARYSAVTRQIAAVAVIRPVPRSVRKRVPQNVLIAA
jgi:hypothetical protein